MLVRWRCKVSNRFSSGAGFCELEWLVVGLSVDQLQQFFLLHPQAGLIGGLQQAHPSGTIHTSHIPATFAELFDLSHQVTIGLAACMVDGQLLP